MVTDDDPSTGPGGTGDAPGLSPALEHLQHAALEAVRAGRALLDAAESAIRDPAALEGVIRTAAGVAKTATETVAGFAAAAGRDPAPDHPSAPDDDADGGYHDISVG